MPRRHEQRDPQRALGRFGHARTRRRSHGQRPRHLAIRSIQHCAAQLGKASASTSIMRTSCPRISTTRPIACSRVAWNPSGGESGVTITCPRSGRAWRRCRARRRRTRPRRYGYRAIAATDDGRRASICTTARPAFDQLARFALGHELPRLQIPRERPLFEAVVSLVTQHSAFPRP